MHGIARTVGCPAEPQDVSKNYSIMWAETGNCWTELDELDYAVLM